MQALSSRVLVLCAEIGVTWHILGAGRGFRPVALCLVQNSAILLAFKWVCLLSVFSRQMHILGAGEVSEP